MMLKSHRTPTASAVITPPDAIVGGREPDRWRRGRLRKRVDDLDARPNLSLCQCCCWRSWCGPCRHEQPYLTQIAGDLESQGVQFFGVDFLDRDHAAAAAFIQEFHVPYPSIYDPDGKLAAAYQVDSPPGKVLVGARGIIVARTDGETTEDKLERLIQAKLLSE